MLRNLTLRSLGRAASGAPLTLNIGRLSNGNAIGLFEVGRLQPDTPYGARP